MDSGPVFLACPCVLGPPQWSWSARQSSESGDSSFSVNLCSLAAVLCFDLVHSLSKAIYLTSDFSGDNSFGAGPEADFAQLLIEIQSDPRYLENLDWGKPRSGHPEGTLRAHLEELDANLRRLSPQLVPDEIARLRVLIHTHDTFKPQASAGVGITHPSSHASLARAFLAEFCADVDLLEMIQYHDEPYALWQRGRRGPHDEERLVRLVRRIRDWDLFVAFLIIDGCTKGKSREPLAWFLTVLDGRVCTRFTHADLLP